MRQKKIFIFSCFILFLFPSLVQAGNQPMMTGEISGWWPNISFVGRIIIGIILTLFVLSAAITLYHYLRFIWERKNLKGVEKNLGNPMVVDAEMEKTEICDRITNRCNSRSTIFHQVKILKSICQQNQTIHYPDVAQLGYMKETSRWSLNFLKFSRANLVVLGLLGTFWGLSMMVGDIDSVFATIDSSNVNALLNSFRKATTEMAHIITPMQTAFSTSLAGLLGTLLLSFFMAGLDRTRKHFFARMESFLVAELAPMLTTKDEAGAAADIKSAAIKLEYVSQNLSGISNDIEVDMEHIHQAVKVFKETADGIITSQELLLSSMENLGPMFDEVRENSRLSREESSHLLTGMEDHLKRMDDVNKRFVNLGINFDEWLAKTITPFNKQQQDFTRILQANADENKNTLSQLGRNVAQHNQNLNDTFRQLLEAQENFVNASAREYGDNMRNAVADVLDGFQRYETAMTGIADKLNTVADDLKTLSRENKNQGTPGSLDKYSQKNLDSIKGTLENMFNLSEKNQRSLSTIADKVKTLSNNGGNSQPNDHSLHPRPRQRNFTPAPPPGKQNENHNKPHRADTHRFIRYG